MVIQRNSRGQFVKGNIASPYYGSHVPDYIKLKISKANKEKHSSPATEFKPKPVDILPNRHWGYLLGLVLGDGFIANTKTRNYSICLESTQKEIVGLFYDSACTLGFNCHLSSRSRHRTLPNGKAIEDTSYRAVFNSKLVYNFLRPYKMQDYRFKVPDLVFQSKDALCGLLQGFFDAEGSVQVNSTNNSASIRVASKHKSNLVQIQNCFDILSIKSHIFTYANTASQLSIGDFDDRMRFKSLVGFKLTQKQAKLGAMQSPTRHFYSREVYLKAVDLEKRGYNLRQIGEQLNIPTTHRTCDVVRSWLRRGKIPRKIILEEKYAKERQTNLGS